MFRGVCGGGDGCVCVCVCVCDKVGISNRKTFNLFEFPRRKVRISMAEKSYYRTHWVSSERVHPVGTGTHACIIAAKPYEDENTAEAEQTDTVRHLGGAR